ncbi:alpha/beta hydrolase [Amycolatopsis jejuensis]|uniref:alpha/beta hydrolase n=1 Tax=Amycolatopsis jejuensis TaxID=330084 RepID=UPI00068C7479|nr:alpha/beta hydrolase-fold protein [Amycolatopsis jejuensis]
MTHSLVDAVRSGQSGAVEELTSALRRAGGPLVEAHPDGGCEVTFVYLGPAHHVAVSSQLTMDSSGRPAALQAIPDTEVWYLTVPVADARTSVSYTYSVDARDLSLAETMALVQNRDEFLNLITEHAKASRPDPFNADRIPSLHTVIAPGLPADAQHESVLTLPEAATDTWFAPGTPPMAEYHLHSPVFGDERTVTVYRPPSCTEPTPLLLLLDGEYHLPHFPAVLDNLIAAEAIPPTVAVFVHNKDAMSRMAEMCCNPALVKHYADELLPWAQSHCNAGTDPRTTIVSGASYGGLGAAWLAYTRPDLFGGVLSLSGSFWWGERGIYGSGEGPYPLGRDDEPEWLTRQFATAPRAATRFWIAAGTLETQPLGTGPNLLTTNRHLRDVLLAKGCDVGYDEYPGGHEHAGWRRTFPDGLRYLLAGART